MSDRWKWALGGLAALALLLSSDGVRNYWRRKATLRKLENSLSKLKQENQSLATELHRLKTDPRLMEQHARHDLGLIQPGETEYRFVRERGNSPKK